MTPPNERPRPKTLEDLMRQRSQVLIKVEAAARAVLPVLLDHGAKHSAEKLSEAIFELDALDQEMYQIVRDDPGKLSALIDRSLGGGR